MTAEVFEKLLERFGIPTAILFIVMKVFQQKDTQQNNQNGKLVETTNSQNDMLVQHLIESNKKRDEDIAQLLKKFDSIIEKTQITNSELLKLVDVNLNTILNNTNEILELARSTQGGKTIEHNRN